MEHRLHVQGRQCSVHGHRPTRHPCTASRYRPSFVATPHTQVAASRPGCVVLLEDADLLVGHAALQQHEVCRRIRTGGWLAGRAGKAQYRWHGS